MTDKTAPEQEAPLTDYEIDVMRDQAMAWHAVVDTLREVDPGWSDRANTGLLSACASIRALAPQPKGTRPLTEPELPQAIQRVIADKARADEQERCARVAQSLGPYGGNNAHIVIARMIRGLPT